MRLIKILSRLICWYWPKKNYPRRKVRKISISKRIPSQTINSRTKRNNRHFLNYSIKIIAIMAIKYPDF
jgi:uncharacterized membrane protein